MERAAAMKRRTIEDFQRDQRERRAAKTETSTSVVTKMRDDAAEIGELYQKARKSAVESVQYLIEAGRRLQKIKDPMKHGEWLPWLKANEKALGFGRLTAWRLMQVANVSPAKLLDLTPEKAREISKKVWGHTKRKGKSKGGPQPSRRKHSPEVEKVAAARVLDHGETYGEAAKQTGLTVQVVKTAVAREEGRREQPALEVKKPERLPTLDEARKAYMDAVRREFPERRGEDSERRAAEIARIYRELPMDTNDIFRARQLIEARTMTMKFRR
jgi:hypothetical protein